MDPNFVKRLTFIKTSFFLDDSILFTVKHDLFEGERTYRLILLEVNGKWTPLSIRHGFRNKECFCEERARVEHLCRYFSFYMHEIYEALKDLPNLRLKLLLHTDSLH